MEEPRGMPVMLKNMRKLDSDTARAAFHLIIETAARDKGIALPFSIEAHKHDITECKAVDIDALARSILKNPDEIDKIYSYLIPQSYRRRLGQFATPPKIAELMALWGFPTM